LREVAKQQNSHWNWRQERQQAQGRQVILGFWDKIPLSGNFFDSA
jgi:hypothetical protein